MSSKYIYPHVPYFYIIQHILSGKLYCGSKWAKGCHPDTFMIEDGYTTSSTLVNNLIKKDGIDSFKTVQIIPETECLMSVYEYETIFLQTNDISKDDNWLNGHNNDGILYPFGSEEYKKLMMKFHGVEHGMHLDWVRNKCKQTLFDNIGYYSVFQSPDHIKKFVELKRDLYGTPNNIEKTKLTNTKNHGVANISQVQFVLDKIFDKHGYHHPFESEEVREKSKQTLFSNHGVENPFQILEIIEQNRIASVARWSDTDYKKRTSKAISDSKLGNVSGEDNPFFGKSHSEESKQKIRDKKSGIKVSRYSCVCCKAEFGINNITQHYNRCSIKTVEQTQK